MQDVSDAQSKATELEAQVGSANSKLDAAKAASDAQAKQHRTEMAAKLAELEEARQRLDEQRATCADVSYRHFCNDVTVVPFSPACEVMCRIAATLYCMSIRQVNTHHFVSCPVDMGQLALFAAS